MVLATSYEYVIDSVFYQTGMYYGPAAASINGGFVYGGSSASLTATLSPYLPGGFSSVGTLAGSALALAGLTNGNYVAVTQDADSINYKIIATDGTVITPRTDIGDLNSTAPDVAALQSGGFVIASQDHIGGGKNYDIELNFYNASGVLAASIIVDVTTADDRSVSIATLDNGNIAVGWTRKVGLDTQIWTAVFTDTGAVVRGPTLLDSVGTINDEVQLTASGSGFAVAYLDNDNLAGLAAVSVATIAADGTVLHSLQLDSNGPAATQPSLARLSNGFLTVTWSDAAGDLNSALVDPSTGDVLHQSTLGSASIDTGTLASASFGSGQFGVISQVAANSEGTHVGESQLQLVRAVRVITGTSANETLTAANDMSHRLDGGGGKDTLISGLANDDMFGGLGNDIYFVNDEHDTVNETGDGGKDIVFSSAFQFTLGFNVEDLTLLDGGVAATGNDLANKLTGNEVDNSLYGGGGNDVLDGKGGQDYMEGGDGNDTYFVDNIGDIIVEYGSFTVPSDRDTVNLSLVNVSYQLGFTIENGNAVGAGFQGLFGNDLANTLTSSGNANSLAEVHYLDGRGGKDTLKGGSGREMLIGGTGADTLTGGGGYDTFVFDKLETSKNKDTIKDFDGSEDDLYFTSSQFTGLSLAAGGYLSVHPEMFALGSAATTADHRLIYNQATGNLYYDADGAGGAAQVLVALLSNKPLVDASDIFIS